MRAHLTTKPTPCSPNHPTPEVARATFGDPPRRTLALLYPCPQTLKKPRYLTCKSSYSCPQNEPETTPKITRNPILRNFWCARPSTPAA